MFEFTSDHDKNIFISLSGLIKNTDGAFKSEKQGKFLTRRADIIADQVTVDSTKKYWGIEVSVGQKLIRCSGMNSWADYGSRGNIPQDFFFVTDVHGVVAKWKVPYDGNLRNGAYPAPDRSSNVWSRPESFVAPVMTQEVPQVDDTPKSQHVGEIGEKIDLPVEIISIDQFIGNSMGYWDSGVRYITKLRSGVNEFIYWGYPKVKNSNDLPQVGDTIQMKATVKDHTEYKGKFSTVVSRPTFKVV